MGFQACQIRIRQEILIRSAYFSASVYFCPGSPIIRSFLLGLLFWWNCTRPSKLMIYLDKNIPKLKSTFSSSKFHGEFEFDMPKIPILGHFQIIGDPIFSYLEHILMHFQYFKSLPEARFRLVALFCTDIRYLRCFLVYILKNCVQSD